MTDENRIKFELKEDKIIDILMHSATREDINKLDAKIDANAKAARDDINKLDSKIDYSFNKLDAKIDANIKILDAKIDKTNDKIDKVVWLILIGIAIPIIMHIFKL